jgi:hypothetical protein
MKPEECVEEVSARTMERQAVIRAHGYSAAS